MVPDLIFGSSRPSIVNKFSNLSSPSRFVSAPRAFMPGLAARYPRIDTPVT